MHAYRFECHSSTQQPLETACRAVRSLREGAPREADTDEQITRRTARTTAASTLS